MLLKKRIIWGVVIVAVFICGAYIAETAIKNVGGKTGLTIEVESNDKPIAYLDAGVIKKLSVQEDGSRTDQSASLSYVLASAGVNSYNTLTMEGTNDGDPTRQDFDQNISDEFLKADTNTVSLVDSKTGEVLIDTITKIIVSG